MYGLEGDICLNMQYIEVESVMMVRIKPELGGKHIQNFQNHLMYFLKFNIYWERSGSVVECLTRDRGAAGLSLTGTTALRSLSETRLS